MFIYFCRVQTDLSFRVLLHYGKSEDNLGLVDSTRLGSRFDDVNHCNNAIMNCILINAIK